MRTTSTVLALCSVVACEKEPPPPAPAEAQQPAISLARQPTAVTPEHTVVPPQAPELPQPQPLQPAPPLPHRRRGPLPLPPSVEPTVYKKWLRDLPEEDRRAVDSFCKKHRHDYQEACGGIGPLHIPYPPYMRVSSRPPHQSLFASVEDWQHSLSGLQRKYIDRECAGGEDQPSSDLCGDNTPLVIAFDSESITFVAGAPFDAPTPSTPWLALDRNGNGTIDGGAELFGSDTVLADGTHAPNGFIALEELDDNRDGVIDVRDPMFASLLLSGTDLVPAANRIVSISLSNHVERRCDARGNCEGERASIVWRDARGSLHDGSIVDVYLPRR